MRRRIVPARILECVLIERNRENQRLVDRATTLDGVAKVTGRDQRRADASYRL
jgi:hypothetical protein